MNAFDLGLLNCVIHATVIPEDGGSSSTANLGKAPHSKAYRYFPSLLEGSEEQ